MPILFDNTTADRNFALFAPRQWMNALNAMPAGERRLPLVVVLHGGGATIQSAVETMQFHLVPTSQYLGRTGHPAPTPVPSENLFFTLYMGGLGFDSGNGGGWNAGGIAVPTKIQHPDDVDLIQTVLGRATTLLRNAYTRVTSQVEDVVDEDHRFVAGFSAGGSMAYRMMADTDLFRAAAVFSGQIGGKVLGDAPAPTFQNNGAKKPLYHYHGAKDDNVIPGSLAASDIGVLNQSDASRDRLENLFGLTPAQADWTARKDLTTVTALSAWLQALGLSLGTPTPLPSSPVTPPFGRYEWGSPAVVRLDVAFGLEHIFPRPGSGHLGRPHGAVQAWEFFKLWS